MMCALLIVGFVGSECLAVVSTNQILFQPTTGPTGYLRNHFTGQLGYLFTVDKDMQVNKLGFYDYGENGLAANHAVRIYFTGDNGATATLVGEAVILAGTSTELAHGFRWVDLDAPITLQHQAEGDDWYILSATTAANDGDLWHDPTADGNGYNVNDDIRGAALDGSYWTDARSSTSIDVSDPPLSGQIGHVAYYIANLSVKVAVLDRTPAHNETVTTGSSLEWTLSTDVLSSVDVYLETASEPNLIEAGNTTGSYLLDTPGTYYWTLVTYDPNEGGIPFANLPEPVWRVTVIDTPVVSMVSPELTTVAAGDDVVLSVTSANADTLRWAKDGIDIPDADMNYSGQDSDTLTILDVQLADEGIYTCTATNSVTSVTSAPGGTVYLEQLVMHYPMDEINIIDSNSITPDIESGYDLILKNTGTGPVVPTLVTNAPNVVVGTGALLFAAGDAQGSPQAYTHLIAKKDIFRNGCTIEFWYKTITPAYRCTPFYAVDDSGLQYIRAYTPWDNVLYWDTNGTGGMDRLSKAKGDLDFSNWVHLAFTKDVYSSTTKIFVNGELFAIATNHSKSIGDIAELYLNDVAYGGGLNGILDEVKFYNYARSTDDIAQDYLAGSGDDFVCDLEGTASLMFDVNGDCEVSLSDFAEFALDWLNSNRIYPAR